MAGDVDMIINTPYGNSGPRIDGYEIRSAAVAKGIPCITTVQGAAAAVQGIEAMKAGRIGVRSLQEAHAALRGTCRVMPTRPPQAPSKIGASGTSTTVAGVRGVPIDAIIRWGAPVSGGFGARLTAAVDALGRCASGSTRTGRCCEQWGLADDADGLARFADACVDALAGHVALVKPQSAFFERHGSRGDRGAGAAAGRVRGHVDARAAGRQAGRHRLDDAGVRRRLPRAGAPLAADAVTLSPYLGFGSLAPALDTAETAGRGVFVLARTSNAEGAAVQAAVADGRSVAQGIVDEAAARNRGVAPVGGVGLVVGATADHGLDLAALNGPVLAPGLGAQGAGPADIAARFRGVRGLVLPSASRSVLAAGPEVRSASAPPPKRCVTSWPPPR